MAERCKLCLHVHTKAEPHTWATVEKLGKDMVGTGEPRRAYMKKYMAEKRAKAKAEQANTEDKKEFPVVEIPDK